MGMPVTIEIIHYDQPDDAIEETFAYFRSVDQRFSTYKPNSEISRINDGLVESEWSPEMKLVLALCEQTKWATNGFFDIIRNGKLDPSGLVKGWAIQQAAQRLQKRKVENFYVEAGGDIQVAGTDASGKAWVIGIRNPFNINEIVKVIKIADKGVATSGTYVRGQHIYDPHTPNLEIDTVKSLTVIGPNIYEADRFATAAFAMAEDGIRFIESLPGLEGYMINNNKIATYTSGFERYLTHVQSN